MREVRCRLSRSQAMSPSPSRKTTTRTRTERVRMMMRSEGAHEVWQGKGDHTCRAIDVRSSFAQADTNRVPPSRARGRDGTNSPGNIELSASTPSSMLLLRSELRDCNANRQMRNRRYVRTVGTEWSISRDLPDGSERASDLRLRKQRVGAGEGSLCLLQSRGLRPMAKLRTARMRVLN